MSFYSTTKLGHLYGLKNPLIFELLMNKGLLTKSNDKGYSLTSLGVQYGKWFHNEKGEQWPVWDINKITPIIEESLKNLKWQILNNPKKPQFNLYHMTHVDNVLSIFQQQYLLSHNQVSYYTDISDQQVNSRRAKIEPIFEHSIHDYVPLYFNVRNAMLYRVQQTYAEKIVILQVDKEICLTPKNIFSINNAATDDAKFYWDTEKFLTEADWSLINKESWSDDSSGSTKKRIMSECLIYDKIPSHFISTIHCQNRKIASTLYDSLIILRNQLKNLKLSFGEKSQKLFFPPSSHNGFSDLDDDVPF